MFYFDNINNHKILRSDTLKEANAYFTTRDGIPFTIDKSTITPEQKHTDNIEFVDNRLEYPNTDGLILKENNKTIYLKFADCTPLIFYDKKQKIGAVAHAGWRGTAKKIGVKTVQKMQSNPNDIIAIIGPAISICCYEVSEDVKEELLSTISTRNDLYKNRNVDLKGINAQQLKEIGVTHIDICPYCTSCHNTLFYSYRKEKGTTNRHYAVLKLI